MGASPSSPRSSRTFPPQSTYTPEDGELLCSFIAQGLSIRAASEQLNTDPKAVYRWLERNPDLRQRYARAREHRAHARYERIDQVLTDMREGLVDAQQARVEVDAIKWQCSKELPSTYGDKLELNGNLNVTVSVADTLRAREQRAGIVDVVPVIQAAIESPKSAPTYPDPSGE